MYLTDIESFIRAGQRGNSVATMQPCFQAKQLSLIALGLYPLWQLHQGRKITCFEFLFVIKALTCCRVFAVAQLTNCRDNVKKQFTLIALRL